MKACGNQQLPPLTARPFAYNEANLCERMNGMRAILALTLMGSGAMLTVGMTGCGLFGSASPSKPASVSQPRSTPPQSPRPGADPSGTPNPVIAEPWTPNHVERTAGSVTTYVSPSMAWRVTTAEPATISKTTDQGQSWTPVATWAANRGLIQGMSWNSAVSGWLGVAAPQSSLIMLYHSSDGGQHWNATPVVASGMPTGMTAEAPLWVSGQYGVLVAFSGHLNQVPGPRLWLWVTDNQGASWENEPASGPGHRGPISWHVPHQGTIAVTFHSHTWISTNYGATWS